MINRALQAITDALKASPTCLAALVIVGLFAVVSYFREERISRIQEARLAAMAQVLERCIPTPEESQR